MYNDTVTLFSRYESRLGDTWYASVLRGVHLNMDKAAMIAKYGPETQDSASLFVRYRLEPLAEGDPQCKQIPWLAGKKLMIGDKIWLPPNEWDAQLGDLLPKTITFEGGNDHDFFWFGEWTGEDTISDDDYEADAGFYGYMNRTHDYVFAVSSVAGPYTVIPHFEIMGK